LRCSASAFLSECHGKLQALAAGRCRGLERPAAPELILEPRMDDPTRADAPALAIRGLRKSFDRPAVDGLDLTVQRGSFFALLGANGAGKTTTLRMTAGLLRPDAGSISIYGVDALAAPLEARRIVAWLPDEPMLYDKLTPLEYLEFVSGLWSVPRRIAEIQAEELLRALDLWGHRDARCEGFSRGMRQKTALAGALIHDPQLLILDEPLTGLDAAIARQVKDLLTARARRGATVILTTHILEVAERLADRIGIIHRGRLLAEGTLGELRESALRPSGAGLTGETLEDVFLDLVSFAGEQAA
jgi:ABC-2 type transport system ATP-binding protein